MILICGIYNKLTYKPVQDVDCSEYSDPSLFQSAEEAELWLVVTVLGLDTSVMWHADTAVASTYEI